MLVLHRNERESIDIYCADRKITVMVIKQGRKGVKLGFEAPIDVKIMRSEVPLNKESKHDGSHREKQIIKVAPAVQRDGNTTSTI